MIKVNTDEIRNGVQPGLKKAKQNVLAAQKEAASIVEPPDFTLKGITKGWASTLSDIVSSIAWIEHELQQKADNFDAAETSNTNLATSLGTSGGTITVTSTYSSSSGGSVGSIGQTSQVNISSSNAGTGKNQTTTKDKIDKEEINKSEGNKGEGEVTTEGEVNKPNIDDTDKEENINNVETSENITFTSTDEFFDKLLAGTGSYGINSEALKDLQELDPIEYDNMKDILINEYKLSETDSEELLNLIGQLTDSSYSSEVNAICSYFKNKPEEFEKIFGFPLYTKNADGELILNDNAILMDYYFWNNAYGENATLIEIQEDGTAILNKDAFEDVQNANWQKLDAYLQWKSDKLSCVAGEICSNQESVLTDAEIKDALSTHLENSEELSINISATDLENAVPLYNTETGEVINNVAEGQWFKVTGTTENGVIVSSNGQKCEIKYEDLAENSKFTFISDVITMQKAIA